MDRSLKEIRKEVVSEKLGSIVMSQGIAYTMIGSMLAPFTVLGTALQLSILPNQGIYGPPPQQLALVELVKTKELAVREMQFNAMQIASGMVGQNKPFQCPTYKNYREAFMALLGQGYQGFFKGNFAGILYYMTCTTLKVYSDDWTGINRVQNSLVRFFATWGLMTGIDILAHPLYNAQTRFILQNRIPKFSTYRSMYFMFTKVGFKECYQGAALHAPINLLYTSMLTLPGSVDPEKRFYIQLAALVLGYPLMTIQRRLTAQSVNHTMLPRRYTGLRYAWSKIYHEEGLAKGLYRGFAFNMIAVLGLLTMLQPRASSLHRWLEEKRYEKESLKRSI